MKKKILAGQEAIIAATQYTRERDYWAKKLSGDIVKSTFPYDHDSHAASENNQKTGVFNFQDEAVSELLRISGNANPRLHMVLTAVLAILLNRYSGNTDIIIGTSIYDQGTEEEFINTVLTLRILLENEQTFKEFLLSVRQTIIEAVENQNYPLSVLPVQAGVSFSNGDLPLFNTVILLENIHNKEYLSDIIPDIGFIFKRLENQLQVEIEYNPKFYQEETILRIGKNYLYTVNAILANLDVQIGTVDVVSEEEKAQLLYEFNNTAANYPKELTIHQLFEKQVGKVPDRIALVGANRHPRICPVQLVQLVRPVSLSYQELNNQANGLAQSLVERGVVPGDIVATQFEQSNEMIISILGILKSGGAYMPIDPKYPPERIAYMLKDSNAKMVLSNSDDYLDILINLTLPPFLQLSFTGPNPGQFIYIIYTSGSTGIPKGSGVYHSGFTNLMNWYINEFNFNFDDNMLLITSPGFDLTQKNIFAPLSVGGKLYLKGSDYFDPLELIQKIWKNKISRLNCTPGMFYKLVEDEGELYKLSGLKSVFLGGEPISTEMFKKWYITKECRAEIINTYGPTECTDICAYYRFKEKPGHASVSIGKPVYNVRLFILDPLMTLLPVGAAGELCIAGLGVGAGYINNIEMTSQKFIKFNRFSESYKTYILYRTGDLTRWLPDGNIEFLGRTDRQVKIRGFRVELEEIENRLLRHEKIKEAVVALKGDNTGDKFLCAYIVPHMSISTGSLTLLTIPQLQDFLSKQLPSYMIPSYFIFIEKVPLTANGKVDRNSLPMPGIKSGSLYIAARNHLEKELTAIWEEVLDRTPHSDRQGSDSKIGIDDNFFEVGGHSLKATGVAVKIHKRLNVKITLEDVFKYPTIRELAEFIKRAKESRFISIMETEKKEYYALSSAQKRMYVLQQIDKASTAYHITSGWILKGIINNHKMENAIRKIIHRHESLRTSFHIVNDQPVQRIHSAVKFAIELNEEREQTRAFNLEKAPLLRVWLEDLTSDEHLLTVDMHHIISDGISMEILVQDFISFYSGKELAGLKIQYKDYVDWQNHKEKSQSQFEFWRETFAGEIPVLELPADYLRPVLQSFKGAHINFEIDIESTRQLKSLAFETGTTLYQVLLVLYTVFLAKISSREDIVIGTPVAGRGHIDLEKIIGMFVNTLALRNFPVGVKKIIDFLAEVKERLLKAFENQDYPYEELVEKIIVNRDTSRNPLFDTLFILQNISTPNIDIPGLKLLPYEFENSTAKFDLALVGIESGESGAKLLFAFEYCTDLFKPETIERFIIYFKNIINAVIENIDRRISEIEIITETEKKEILYDTGIAYLRDKTIPQLFAEQVAKTPDYIALVGANRHPRVCPDQPVQLVQPVSLSYQELNNQANKLAQSLIEQGIILGDIVALQLERSNEMIIGILGILKSGAAYMPLNPNQPEARTQFMIKDSGAKMIGRAEARKSGSEGKTFANTSSLAYIIYTSGSTGNPKGVPITHANFSPLIHWGYKNLGISEKDRVIQNLSYYFDWSVWEIFIALTTGASLHMISESVLLNPEAEVAFILKNAITVLHITPTQYGYLLNVGQKLSTLKYLFIGAEKLTFDVVERSIVSVNDDCRIFNMYGPTEATIISAVLEINKAQYITYKELTSVPIGSPAAGLLLVVLNRYGQLCPVKIVGELYIAGPGVANGYLNNPELSAEKFNFNRSYWSYRAPIFYKTGDLARWLPEGTIEFLGRIDYQVKIRGYRIELGEIENKLLEHERVKATVVTVSDKIDLCAYIVPQGPVETVDELELKKELKEYLNDRLPGYMVPSFIVIIEKIVLNPNGKVDLRALPQPEAVPVEDYIAPRNDVEEKLAKIWADVLDNDLVKDRIGINADFFELGGHSLKATALVSRVHKELHVMVPLAELFITPTIRGLSEYIKNAKENIYKSIIPVEEKEYYGLSSAQERMYILQQMDLNSTAYNMPQIIPLQREVEIEKLEETFKQLIERHESLRTSFHMVGNQPVQEIHKEVDFKIEYYNSPGIMNFVRTFDLSQAPLLRAGLINPDTGKCLLMVDMHHIISDGVSQLILREDFAALYERKELSPLRVQYKDFAQWQNSREEVEKINRQMLYWLKEFEGEIPVLELPLDYPRPLVQSFEGGSIQFQLSAEETRGLNALAMKAGGTLFMILAAIVNILLAKLSGQEEIIIGTTIAGRRHPDLEKIIGMFVNTLVLRNYPAGEQTVNEFLEDIKEKILLTFENQEYPFESLVDKLTLKRDMGRNPLFDVMFVLQNMDKIPVAVNLDEEPTGYEDIFQAAKFELTFIAMEIGQKTFFTIQYCTKIFKKESIERFRDCFKKIISNVLDVLNAPGIRISEIDIISEEERKQVLHDFNDTESDYPHEKTIHQLFEEQMSKVPDQIALFGESARFFGLDKPVGQVCLTYGELGKQSDRLAGLLIEKGVLAGDIIGIMMERSIEMIIGIFGILKAGGAYLPIDPGYPQERIQYMLKDSAAKILLTAIEMPSLFEEYVLNSHHSLVTRHHSNCPAYIIYTSGSTGMPKGVMIEHRSVINRLNWMQKAFPIDSSDGILQKTTFTFDVSVWELFWWSFCGSRANLLGPGEEKDPVAIVNAVGKYRITTMHFVPSMLNAFLDYLENVSGDHAALKKLRSLKQLFTSGEALSPLQVTRFYQLCARWGLSAKLINLYGPTEATVDVSYFECIRGETHECIPIGKPIDNINLYVLDKSLHLRPIGAVGELFIGGVGLARGYLNNPELTSEKFKRFNKFYWSYWSNRSSILYKTGDLARWLPGGNIEFLGRVDSQVKIRGFRIELGEIESLLITEPAVKETAVIAKIDSSGDNQLTAYVVPDEKVAFTVHRLLEIERGKRHGDRPYYELPNGMPVFYLNRNETEFMYREVFEEYSYLRHGITLKEGSYIFDIGANIGLFSLFANHICKDAQIYAFEPVPSLYDLLVLNTSLYGTNFKLFKNGISSKEEEVLFTYYPHASILSGRFANNGEEKETVKAFIHRELEMAGDNNSDSPDRLTEEQIEELLKERLSGVQFNCRMKTISQVIRENGVERIDLMKIDVEKAELDVLAGIEAEDWPKIKQLVIEVHEVYGVHAGGGRLNKIIGLLKKHGYKVTVEQDTMLEETGLYNLYAIKPTELQEPGHIGQVESTWYSPGRLIEDLKESLKNQLPGYMIPSHFVLLDKMPLTASGKLDRKALLLIEPELKWGETYEAPADEIEETLVGIWSEILGIDKNIIGMNANFFDLGGHSLKATVLVSRIHKELNVIFPLAAIFKTPTIRKLSEYIKESKGIKKDFDRHLVLLKEGISGNNHLFLLHDGRGEVEGYVEFCKQLTIDFNCWGIRPDPFEKQATHEITIGELAETYIRSIKKIQPHGPYYIAGWSLGGTIAFEMAVQLEQIGEEIALLALIDSPPPHKNLWQGIIEFKDETIYNLELSKALLNARALYQPAGKIHTPVHYIGANQSKMFKKEHWRKYCNAKISYYKIDGDHFSIFKMPRVIDLSMLFSQLLPRYNNE